MSNLLRTAVLVGLLAGPGAIGHADVIASNTAGTFPGVGPFYAGQSFNTPTGSPLNNITFNFFMGLGSAHPYAIGTGFLLSQEYTGSPNDLNTSTPGFLGETTAAGGFYSFGPSVTLNGGSRYYFYETTAIQSYVIYGGNIYSGGNNYSTLSSSEDFTGFPDSNNFQVTGTAVPEPSILALVGLGALGLAAAVRRRKTRS